MIFDLDLEQDLERDAPGTGVFCEEHAIFLEEVVQTDRHRT